MRLILCSFSDLSDCLDDGFSCATDLRAIELVSQVLDAFRPCWVRIDALTNLAQSKSIGHSLRNDAD